jgi:hypothetical protein
MFELFISFIRIYFKQSLSNILDEMYNGIYNHSSLAIHPSGFLISLFINLVLFRFSMLRNKLLILQI